MLPMEKIPDRELPWQYKLEMFFFGHCNTAVVIMSIVSHMATLEFICQKNGSQYLMEQRQMRLLI